MAAAAPIRFMPAMKNMSLNFHRSVISDESGEALPYALFSNTVMTSLDLDFRSTEIGDEGAEALADALRSHTALTKLR